MAPCHDCRIETLHLEPPRRSEFYMVTDEVWAAAGMGKVDGCLCIGCLEARIGRRLVPDDFPADIPMNSLDESYSRYAWWWRTPRLLDRMTR